MEMNNVFVLRDMINLCGGQVIGRKKMQKIVYIVQEFANPFELPFEYKWNYYGVYSNDLTDELRIGQFFKIFEETPVKEHGYQSYAIKVKDNTEPTDAIRNKLLGELMRFLNSKEPRLLEVISSIVFFEKEGFSQDEINSRLLEFKGHLKEFFDDAYDALEIIKGM